MGETVVIRWEDVWIPEVLEGVDRFQFVLIDALNVSSEGYAGMLICYCWLLRLYVSMMINKESCSIPSLLSDYVSFELLLCFRLVSLLFSIRTLRGFARFSLFDFVMLY